MNVINCIQRMMQLIDDNVHVKKKKKMDLPKNKKIKTKIYLK